MILADTSVWISHLRSGNHRLAALLTDGLVACHSFVIGELACGSLHNRTEILSRLVALPSVTVAGHGEALRFASDHKLYGKGLGWIDVHLLASALMSGCALWTHDKPLAAAAQSLRVHA